MSRLCLLPLATLLLAPSCSSTTTIAVFPANCAVYINGKHYGPSPARVVLPNTAFGSYTLTLKQQETTVFHEVLPLEFVAWGIFWPPGGMFYNLHAVSPEYEIDVNAKAEPPSEERQKPHRQSKNAAANILTDMGFDFLDRGFLREARYYLEVASRVDTQYPDALLGMAIYHRKKGSIDETRTWLARYSDACRIR